MRKIFINNNVMTIINYHVFNESNFYNPLHLTTREQLLMFEYWVFHEFGTGYSGTHPVDPPLALPKCFTSA
jgi:hypothetical protein